MKATMSVGVKLAVLTGFFAVPLMTAAEREAAGGARPPAVEQNAGPFYVTNRAPLMPSAFMKLPIGTITPKGWLRRQLELEASGMTGYPESKNSLTPDNPKSEIYQSLNTSAATGDTNSSDELPGQLRRDRFVGRNE